MDEDEGVEEMRQSYHRWNFRLRRWLGHSSVFSMLASNVPPHTPVQQNVLQTVSFMSEIGSFAPGRYLTPIFRRGAIKRPSRKLFDPNF